MGKHSGDVEDQPRSPALRKRLLRLSVGLTATLVAWGYLVFAAIDFGGDARAGESIAWLFLAAATVGATACLFAFLVLVPKLLETLRGEEAQPRSTAPGKRAAR